MQSEKLTTDLNEFIGQKNIVTEISKQIDFSLKANQPLQHILLCAPTEMGQKLLLNTIAQNLNKPILFVKANEIIKPSDLINSLAGGCGSIIVISDFKDFKKDAKEYLYQAIDKNKIEIIIDAGPAARSITIDLEQFTVVFVVLKPLEIEERFRRWCIPYSFIPYSLEELRDIVMKIGRKYEVSLDIDSAMAIGHYCNGKPGNAEVIIRRIASNFSNSHSKINIDDITRILDHLGYGKMYPQTLTIADKFNQMSGIEFEKWVADYFRKQNFEVKETNITGDHGIDIFLYENSILKAAVQCKRWDSSIGEPTVREFYGSLLHSKAPIGYIFATSSFIQQAINFSEDKPIKLIDFEKIILLESSKII